MAPWTAAERQAWAPREQILASTWVDRHAWIPDNGINPEPGPVSLDRTPYLRGILDAVGERGVKEVDFLKCTQVGFSTLLRLLLCHWIDQDPGPALVLLPDELSAKEWLEEDVVPTLEETPRLQRHLLPRKRDNKATAIRLATMAIFVAWAGSPQRLARRPIRYFLGDEVDKYPAFSGKEAGPISLGLKRLSNWSRRAKAILGSTPTTRLGNIWLRWEACADQRSYHVPCPHCGIYQMLIWEQVKGWKPLAALNLTKVQLATRVEVERLAYYECISCKEKIEDRHKHAMLLRGVWASQTQTVSADGTLKGDRPASMRVGFQLNSLYAPSQWVPFSTLASEWIMADGDIALTMDFWNSRMARPFEQRIAKTRPSTIRAKVQDDLGRPLKNGPPPLIVPRWTKVLIATADTQGTDSKDGWHPWAVRAWSYSFRSQLVGFGIAQTFSQLKAQTIDRFFEVEKGGETAHLAPLLLLIDSGGPRWSEVYEFAQSDPARIHASKGASTSLEMPVSKSHLKSRNLVLWRIDTGRAKDLLNRLIHDPDPGLWMPHAAINDDYCSQLASEHKIIDPRTKQSHWELVTPGSANHLLDVEALQCAAAWELGCWQAAPVTVAPTESEQTDDPRQNWRGKY